MPSNTYLQQVARQPGNAMTQLRPTHALFQHWQSRQGQERLGAPIASAPVGALTDTAEGEFASPTMAATTFAWPTSPLPARPAPAPGLQPPAPPAATLAPSPSLVETMTPEKPFLRRSAMPNSGQATNAPAARLHPVDTRPEPITANPQPASPFLAPPTRVPLVQGVSPHPAAQPNPIASAPQPIRRPAAPLSSPTGAGLSPTSDRHPGDKPQRTTATPAPEVNRAFFRPSVAPSPAQSQPPQPITQPLRDQRSPQGAVVAAPPRQSAAQLAWGREPGASHPTIQIGAVEIRITPAPPPNTAAPPPTITATAANVRSAGEAPAPATSLLARGFGSSFGLRQS